jgi:dihydrofolate reductase
MTNQNTSVVKICLVVAAAKNRVIGKDGAMPWTMPGDLKTFRRLTLGNPIIMGRKTFQSIGRLLDGRCNIIVTRDRSLRIEGAAMVTSVDDAIAHATSMVPDGGCVMVIGGGEIYAAALPLADIIYLTEIAAEPDGDTWFPELDMSQWAISDRSGIAADSRDQYAAELITYVRKRSGSGKQES